MPLQLEEKGGAVEVGEDFGFGLLLLLSVVTRSEYITEVDHSLPTPLYPRTLRLLSLANNC